ncbi:MAG TPA: YbaB/EbfC family nucleoid-associated protein [Methylomusa anaerophila]|uniref:Nucleoid-associated protein MAMMFC1_01512 n=1 Tax=Methylomusa anaerophila TaxID=1930071 RepID=A0A348AIF0_9FIRM|nr:YbaB/EbfC family nucleoid-associated protein [Methylomusa anaerophila]BBB90848.1 nucleoid-associated protein [Methylomusa anaerophila]HML90642.1 YbaB/EbfC family nucleoid-associated protein [Methylomusa anaerophila]
MLGNMGNMAGMMKKVQKLQAEMAKLQEELKSRTIEVSTGGGAVKVVVNGEKRIQSIKIAPNAVDPEDVEMLEDLVTAAVNEAMTKVDDMMASEMGKLTGGLNLPPGMF